MLKAFKILHITVDIQLIELTEKPAHAKARYWVYMQVKKKDMQRTPLGRIGEEVQLAIVQL